MLFKSLKVYLHQDIDLEVLASQLVDFNYQRQELVANEGDFSSRGDIVDIFPFSFELPIRIVFDHQKIISLKTFNPENGQALWLHNLVIILPFKKPSGKRVADFTSEFPLKNFVDLTPGDLVVHNQHGIGKFLGMQKIKLVGGPKDHLVIEYDRGEKLYVPVSAMHLVQKYIAFQARKPKLYRLGTKEWQRVKEVTRKGIQKLAWDLLSLQAVRLTCKGNKFSPDTAW